MIALVIIFQLIVIYDYIMYIINISYKPCLVECPIKLLSCHLPRHSAQSLRLLRQPFHRLLPPRVAVSCCSAQ